MTLFEWTEEAFLKHTEGSAIRRIGHQRWLRNIAVAMGNALRVKDDAQLRGALQKRLETAEAVLFEHIHWALDQ